MPFIWNDKTFWSRYFKSTKYFTLILLPLILISMLFWYFLESETPKIIHLLLVSYTTGLTLYGLLGIFFLFPNANIPDNYHPVIKRLVYTFYFIVGLMVTFFIATKFNLIGSLGGG